MLKVYTTGPILNANGVTPAAGVVSVFSDKFTIEFDPLFSQRYNANCCPCYVVATLYRSAATTLEKTVVATQSVILSDKNYSVIEFTGLLATVYEVEVKIFCPGNTPIFNIFGLKGYDAAGTGTPFALVPCHCFKFKDLVAIDTDCCCEDEDRRSDSDEGPISDCCDKHYRPRNNKC